MNSDPTPWPDKLLPKLRATADNFDIIIFDWSRQKKKNPWLLWSQLASAFLSLGPVSLCGMSCRSALQVLGRESISGQVRKLLALDVFSIKGCCWLATRRLPGKEFALLCSAARHHFCQQYSTTGENTFLLNRRRHNKEITSVISLFKHVLCYDYDFSHLYRKNYFCLISHSLITPDWINSLMNVSNKRLKFHKSAEHNQNQISPLAWRCTRHTRYTDTQKLHHWPSGS